MIDLQKFLSNPNSMIVAPAGYGKTHTIVDCIEICEDSEKVLILTHTHAGIASILKKVSERGISPNKYHVDTICGFALDLVRCFLLDKNILPNKNDKQYFKILVVAATNLLKAKPIQKVLSCRYNHLIVDEYQDCSIKQHSFIMMLSNILSTHILGDPMQGIFTFNDTPVDMEHDERLRVYRQNSQRLTVPWRWIKHNALNLGLDINCLRKKLRENCPIDLESYGQIEFLLAKESDIYSYGSSYSSLVRTVINQSESLLIIQPNSKNEDLRVKFIKSFPGVKMVEALDPKLLYDYADLLDSTDGDYLIECIVGFCEKISKKTIISQHICGSRVKRNNKYTDNQSIEIRLNISNLISKIHKGKSYLEIANLITYLLNIPGQKIYRYEFAQDMLRALKEAELKNSSLSDAVLIQRDKLRRRGRQVMGKVIGTTLLTKGLEFDTVLVMDAHRFATKENLYVALSRCCKRLIVVSERRYLTF